MAEYKLTNTPKGGGRTSAYRFTTTSKQDPSLLALKTTIKQFNAGIRSYAESTGKIHKWGSKLQRVHLMARGPRTDGNGWYLHRNSASCLQHKYATHYDVYVTNCSSNHAFEDRISLAMTTKQYSAYCTARSDMWAAKMEISTIKRIAIAIKNVKSGEYDASDLGTLKYQDPDMYETLGGDSLRTMVARRR